MSVSNTCRSCKQSFSPNIYYCPKCGVSLDCGFSSGLSQMDIRKLKPRPEDEERSRRAVAEVNAYAKELARNDPRNKFRKENV